MSKLKNIHYGWVVTFASMVLAGTGSGIFASTLGVFVRPVCEDLGFLRAEFTLYSTIFFILNVVVMSVFGTLFRRFGFRKVGVICAVVLSLSLLGYSFSTKLWQFYTCAAVSGLFFNGLSMMAVGILVGNWFIEKRGLASGIAYSGSGLMAAALIPICTAIIESYGWQMSFRFLALVELAVSVPVILFIVKDKPEDIGLKPYGYKENSVSGNYTLEGGMTVSKALRTVTFWLLFFSIFILTVCVSAPNSNTVSILGDIGYSSAYAASVSSTYMILLTVCKISIGYVIDRVGSLGGSMLISGCCILFPITALFNDISFVPWIYITFLAIAASGATVLATVLTGSYFGRKDYARIYSIIAMGPQLGSAISTPLLGLIYDTTGAYDLLWYIFAGLAIAVFFWLLFAYRTSKKLELTQ